MIIKALLVLKKHSLLVSILYTIALIVFSLITIDLGGIESYAPSYGDKIFHFCAYALLTYTWHSTLRNTYNVSNKKAILYVSVCAFLFGIIIEVLQKVFTYTRFFDIDDITANSLGVLLTCIVLWFNIKRDVKKY